MDDSYYSYENTPGVDYHELYNLTNSTWLAIGGMQVDAVLSGTSAFGLHLNDAGVLAETPLFQWPADTLESQIYLMLTWFSFHPERGKEVESSSINFNPEDKELSFPEMVKPQTDTIWLEEPTGKTIRLQFNGKYFEQVMR